MGRISKTLATKIALKMTEAKLKTVKERQLQTQTLAYELTRAILPKDVLAAHDAYPGYFQTSYSRYFYGGGLNHEDVRLSNRLPHNNSIVVQLSDEDGQELLKLNDDTDLLINELTALRRDIQNTILAIGTTTRLKKEFPEAAVHLPVEMTTALAFNLPDLLKRL